MKCSTIAAAVAGLLAGVVSAADASKTSSLLEQPSSPPKPNLPTVQGCWSSAAGLEVVNETVGNSMGSCGKTCLGKNYNTAATQGYQCYCGNVFPPASMVVDDKQCDQPCPGYPLEACGGSKAFTVYTTGKQLTGIDNEPEPSSSSTPSATPKPTESGSGPAASQTSGAAQNPGNSNGGGGGNTAAIAAGVVVGVVVLAAIGGGAWFWLRRRRNREIEEEHRRNAAVNAFIHGSKPGSSGGVSMTDSRMDPSLAQRRMSDGSIADNQDYSRRILRVTNA